MICDGCQKEVIRATVMFEGDERWYLCVHCVPVRKSRIGLHLNKSGGYTVSPAYYEDITTRRMVRDAGEKTHHVENRVNRTHFVT